MNIYFLAGTANKTYEADHEAVISADFDGVLVECSLNEARTLAREWGLSAPMLAKDGVHYSYSGDAVYIANGEQVNNIEAVAVALAWPGEDESGLDAEDYLRTIGRIF